AVVQTDTPGALLQTLDRLGRLLASHARAGRSARELPLVHRRRRPVEVDAVLALLVAEVTPTADGDRDRLPIDERLRGGSLPAQRDVPARALVIPAEIDPVVTLLVADRLPVVVVEQAETRVPRKEPERARPENRPLRHTRRDTALRSLRAR